MLSSPDFLSSFRTIWHFIESCLTVIFVAALLLLVGYHVYLCFNIWVYGLEAILEDPPSSPSWQRVLARRPERRGRVDDVEARGEERVKYEYESVVDWENAYGYGAV